MGLLPEVERGPVRQQACWEGRKASLVGLLAARGACCLAHSLRRHDTLVLRRTRGQRPFLASPLCAEMPNFNFSIARAGSLVVVATDAHLLCGADVVAPRVLVEGSLETAANDLQHMSTYFTDEEIRWVQQWAMSDGERDDRARKLWSVKEALAKARGDGLAMDFKRIEVQFLPSSTGRYEAIFKLDGVHQPDWLVTVETVEGHSVAVALGPVRDLSDADGHLRGVMRAPHQDAAWRAARSKRANPFRLVTLQSLLPPSHLQAYMDSFDRG